MLQRKGAEPVGQLARVPDPNTDAYGVFSIAIMTIWSKLDPVGAAETGRGEIRRATLNAESATNSNGNPIFFRVWSTLILFQSCLVRFGFPTRSARDTFRVAENQTLFVERVPRQYSLLSEDSQRQF